MTQLVTEPTPIPAPAVPEPAAAAEPVTDELLIEEISIDGMCGVY